MARGKFSAQKRLREASKRQKKMEKEERRDRRKTDQEGEEPEENNNAEDPDIAGIVPGPQPPLPEFTD